LKVIHILHSLKYSGAEIMYVDAAELFRNLGCELSVVATATDLGEYAPFFENAGYKIFHLPIPSFKNYFRRLRYYFSIIRLLKVDKYDVIHIHSHDTMFGMAFCGWMAKVQPVYTFHSVFPTKSLTYPYHVIKRWIAKQIFNCRFQAISDSVYNHELKFYHNNTTKIYNWINNRRYFPALKGEKKEIRNELDMAPGAFVIISVGGCNVGKQHSDIINAMPVILKKIPDCYYLHLGNGDLESAERQLAIDLQIADRVIFCGNREDVRKYLIASDVFLMPSHYEGFSLTTVEAMACGIPAILYDVPGLRDFNKHGIHSILIKEDYNLIAENVLFIYSNPDDGNAMARSAKSFVDKNFNMEQNVKQIYELYKTKTRR